MYHRLCATFIYKIGGPALDDRMRDGIFRRALIWHLISLCTMNERQGWIGDAIPGLTGAFDEIIIIPYGKCCCCHSKGFPPPPIFQHLSLTVPLTALIPRPFSWIIRFSTLYPVCGCQAVTKSFQPMPIDRKTRGRPSTYNASSSHCGKPGSC